jgi:transposase InsO family protein
MANRTGCKAGGPKGEGTGCARVNFQQLYILVVLDHGRRIVRHLNVTANPTSEWVKQQIREAFPYDQVPKLLIHDRDQTFKPLKAFLETLGIEPKLTAYHCPWQNGFVERMNQSLRRELLDYVIPLSVDHLRRLLMEYLRYYHEDRTHLGLDKDSPRGRLAETKPSEDSVMKAMPRCGGLHHRYGLSLDPHQREPWGG